MEKDLLESFVRQSLEILGDHLVGIYLHGSLAMGCFRWDKSDIDLLVVVDERLSRERQPEEWKRRYMDMVVELNALGPAKGIEMSVVREKVCDPFVYPTPYELHFSNTHLAWFQSDPTDYVKRMNGTDKDLAAHFTILRRRGRTLYGKELKDVFGEVDETSYFDSIFYDVENAERDVLENPMYVILNLCRVWAYRQEKLVLSKREGGEWALHRLPEKDRELVERALADYTTDASATYDKQRSRAFAAYLLEEISK